MDLNKEEITENESTTEKKQKHDNTNSVVLCQIAVCSFVILLIFAVGKFSPDTFNFIKEEYNKIIAEEIKKEDVVNSVQSVVEEVMPVASAESDDEKDQTDEESVIAEEDKDEDEKVVSVMAFSKNDTITVPVHGRITSRFGYRTNPITGSYANHSGVDIAADKGTKISAAYDGVVEKTGTGMKEGKFVKILHSDGSKTLYCHCSEILVNKDEVIRAGEIIAKVGSTGWATGPHLHFEIQSDGEKIDPLTVLEEKNGRV